MQNIFVEFLPPWIETGLQPAFYDKESGTVLQQVARMYAKVNWLIKMFNEFSKDTTDFVNNFVDETNTEIERFETATNDEIERFEGVVDTRVTNFERDTTDIVNDYIARFVALKDFVDDYFDNLDVQQEIDHKLDEMLLNGTLQEIITTYIQSKVAWTFDTVADMKNATNLIDGSYAQTLGFYTLNDGGGAIYYISDSGTADEMSVIAVDDLYAHLVQPTEINIKQVGCKGDGTTDDTTCFNYAVTNYSSIIIPAGTFLIDFSNINIASKSINGINKATSIIKQKNSGTALFTIGARTKLANLTIEAENNSNHESIIEFGNSYTGDYDINNLYIKCPNSIALNCDVNDGYRVGGTIKEIYIENPYVGISLLIPAGVNRTNYFTRFFISNITIVNPTHCGIETSCASQYAQLSHANINNISVQLATSGSTGIKLSGNSMLNFSNIFTFIEGAGITFQNTYGIDFGDTEFSTNLIRKTAITNAKIEGGFKNEVNKNYFNLINVEHIIGTKSLITNSSVLQSTIGAENYESPSLLKEGRFVEDFNPSGDTHYRASSNFTSYEVKTDFFGKKYVEIVTGTGGLTEYRYEIDFPSASKSTGYITMYAVVEMANVTDTLPLPWIYAVSGEATGTRTSVYVPSTSYPNRFAITKTVNMADYLNGSAYRFGLSLPANTTVKIYKLDVVRGHQNCMDYINFD